MISRALPLTYPSDQGRWLQHWNYYSHALRLSLKGRVHYCIHLVTLPTRSKPLHISQIRSLVPVDSCARRRAKEISEY